MRSDLGAQVVVQKGIEPCLYVLPPDEWERQVQRVSELPTTNPDARRYARHFFSQASAERIDAQGRLTIPQTQRDYAGLERDVVIVGAGRRVEIWDASRWEAQRGAVETNLEDLARDLGI
jgi:MraZ protein